jgi:hypothetical protein
MLYTGVTFLNSPNFHLAFSGANNNTTLFGITISASGTSPNTDGMDLAGSNFLVQNCSISDGDDNIVAKPGSVFCRNIYIANCAFGTGHGVSIGGQTNVGLDGMTVTNCTFDGTSSALRFKADPTEGGPVQNVTFSNLTMTNVQYPILFYSYYNLLGSPGATSGSSQITPAKVNTYNAVPPSPLASTTIPTWQNITVTNLTVINGSGYSTIWGLPLANALIANVTLNNVNIQGGAGLELYDATNIQLTGSNSVGPIITDNALAITGQPAGQTVNVGASVTFSATAVGGSGTNNTGLTYQWNLNGAPLTDGVQADGSTITGSATATLAIANTRVTGAGNYTVTVSTTLDGYNTSTNSLVANSLPVSATSAAAVLTVNPLPASIALSNLTQTYDGTIKAPTVVTTPAGLALQIAYDGGATPLNAGNYPLTATITDLNYLATPATGTLRILPASLAVAADPQVKVYGNADPTFTYTVSGLQAADTTASVLTGALTRIAGESVAGSPYAIQQGTLVANANYVLSFTGATLAITPAPLTVTAAGLSKVYGSADPALAFTLTSGALVIGDGFTGSLVRAAGENVGAYAIARGTLTAGSNYALSFVGASLTITPATASVTVQGYTGAYDGQPHGATGTATGVNNANLASLLNLGATFTNVPGGTAAWTFHDPAGNYNDASGTVAIILTKAAAQLTLGALTQTYGGGIADATVTTSPANLTVLWTYNGLPLAFTPVGGTLAAYAPAVGQTIFVNVTGAAGGTVSGTGFGPYAIASDVNTAAALAGLVQVGQSAVVEVTISDDGTSFQFAPTLPTGGFTTGPVQVGTYDVAGTIVDWNYSGTVEGVLTIGPATVFVTADAQTKVYGAADPALTYTASGLQPGDTAAAVLTGVLTRAGGEDAGSYAIAQGSLTANSNYTLSFTGSTLTIAPATLAVAADSQTKTYGAADPALTYVATGFQFSDTAASVLSGALARAAGESVAGSPYAIEQGTLAANGNYTIAFTGSTLAITPAPLTVTAATMWKVYGSPDPSLGFTLTSGALVGSDSFSGSLVRITGENVGAYAIAQGTLTAGSNYTLSFVGASLTIAPKPASITPNPATKVYGSADPVLTGTLTGFLAVDSVTATYGRTAGETVGGSPYTISATLSPGTALGNYAITAKTAAFTITPATLAVAADAKTKVYGAADPALTYVATGFQFSDTAAGVLTGTLTRAAGETVQGSPYAIRQGTLAANSNYTIGFAGSTLAITAATASVSVQGFTGVYDGQPHGATGTATGVNNANLANLLNLGASFSNVPGGTANWTFHDPAGNYSDASGSVAITIGKAAAAVAVTPYAITYDGNAHTATGTATGVSGAALAGLNLSGTTHTAAGTYSDPWTFTDATGNYNNASGTVSDSIARAKATVVVTPYSVVYDGSAHTATGSAKGVKGESLAGLSLAGTTHTNAGTYTDTWTFTDVTGNYNNASATVTDQIGIAAATITLAPLAQMYDGQPKPVTATTTPAGLNVSITYNGSSTAPTLPGSYTVVATIVSGNYAGAQNAVLTIGITALVRHGPTLDGDIDGSLQVLTGENITLNGNAGISGDLLVPGLPTVQLNGRPTFAGVHDSTGAATPTNYTVTLNGNSLLRYLVRRVDPLALPTVAAPDLPKGARAVSMNRSTDPIGAWSTLKDLTLNSNVGNVAVPAGVYGSFTANGGSGFTLGVAGATTPSVYEFQSLTLNSNSALNIVGPVIIVLKNDLNVNGGVGAVAHPEWLDLRVSNGSVTLNGNVAFHSYVTAPSGTVTINGNTTLTGGVAADRLVINGNGTLVQPTN